MKIFDVPLREVVSPEALAAAVTDGLVRVQRHPSLPLRIFNYTEQAVYTRSWNSATTVSRGLIVDDADMVRARPWPKFFNHGEMTSAALDLDAPVEVTDKADGSLGILFPASDGLAIATRGSFASDQARHATAVYRERYTDTWTPVPGWTYLFEIIYPANRIVLSYGDTDDLVLLGAVEIATGATAGPRDEVSLAWPGPRTEVASHRTLAEALAAPPRPNSEGLVVRYLGGPSAGLMLKLKQADYIALHRIVTGLTARRIWERSAVHAVLAAEPALPHRRVAQTLHLDPADVPGMVDAGPDWLEALRQSVPEEFLDWIEETTVEQQGQVSRVLAKVQDAVTELNGLERREIAVRIAGHPYRSLIFASLDGHSVLAQAWASIRPAADRPFGMRGEDVA